MVPTCNNVALYSPTPLNVGTMVNAVTALTCFCPFYAIPTPYIFDMSSFCIFWSMSYDHDILAILTSLVAIDRISSNLQLRNCIVTVNNSFHNPNTTVSCRARQRIPLWCKTTGKEPPEAVCSCSQWH